VKIEILTLFPELVEQVVRFGIPRKAVETGYTFGRGRDAHPPEPLED